MEGRQFVEGSERAANLGNTLGFRLNFGFTLVKLAKPSISFEILTVTR
jgi:hypothetical protein